MAPYSRFVVLITAASLTSGCPRDAVDRDPVMAVVFDARPSEATSETRATIAFRATRAAAFECELDAAPPYPCTSPQQLVNLHDGIHVFRVLARGEAGGSAESSVTWAVSTASPVVRIDTAPATTTRHATAELELSANGVGPLELACELDDLGPTPCTSPIVYSALTDGEHLFTVAVIDAQGRRAVATHRWVVDTVPPAIPELTATALDRGMLVTIHAGADRYRVEYDLNASFAAPSSSECASGGACIVGPLENCRMYHVRAVATDTAGNEAASAAVAVTPMPAILPVSVAGEFGVIQVVWSDRGGATGSYGATYRVEYGPQAGTYGGAGAAEGGSPVEVQEGTHLALRGLPPEDVVHVRVVKVDGQCEGDAADYRATPYPWRWVAPTPTGNSLRAVTCTSSGRCLALGDIGTALTTDDGVTWTRRNGGTPHDFMALSMATPSVGYALAAPFFPWAPVSTLVFGTADAGATWLASGTPDTTTPLRGIAFTDASVGIVVGDGGTMFRTTDGASTWQSVGASTTADWKAVVFRTASDAVAVGSGGRIATSADGGATWTVRTSGTAGALLTVDCPSALRCWAAGEGGIIITTSDGGSTWRSQSSTSSCPTPRFRSVSFSNDATGWAVGDEGRICATNNGGLTWTHQVGPGYGYGLEAVHAETSTSAWIVATDGLMYRTRDGGAQWSLERKGPAWWLQSLWAPDAESLLAVGAGGMVVRSLDGGVSWSESRPVMSSLNAISPLDASSAIAVGDDGVVLKTTDFGATWTSRPSAGTGMLRDVQCISPERCWIASTEGLLATADSGETWRTLSVGAVDDFAAVRFSTESVGYAAEYRWPDQEDALLWRTTDAGNTWTALRTAMRVRAIAAPNPLTVYVGQNSSVKVSMDGGAGWETLANVVFSGDVDDVVVSGDLLLAVGSGPRSQIVAAARVGTTDGRESCTATDKPLNAIVALSPERWIAAGAGAILETVSGGR